MTITAKQQYKKTHNGNAARPKNNESASEVEKKDYNPDNLNKKDEAKQHEAIYMHKHFDEK